MRKASFLTALLLLAPAVSQAKSLEELLVEKGVITKGEAASASSTESGPAKVYYNEGTRIEFPDAGFTTTINTLLQARYTFSDEDEDGARRNFDAPNTYNNNRGVRSNTSSFDVYRARLIVSGTAVFQEFAYKLEGDFVGNNNDGFRNDETDFAGRQNGGNIRETALKDAWIQWQPCEGFGTRLGQFKTFLGRQWQASEAKLQFANRSILTDYFALGRMQGAAQTAEFMDGRVQMAAGVFNGTSDYEGINRSGIDTDKLGVGTVRFNPTGKMDSLEEGDVDYTEDLATTIGASYAAGEGHNDVGLGRMEDTSIQRASVDAGMKLHGFSLQTEYFWSKDEVSHRDVNEAEPHGGYVQAGVFLKPKTWEVAARYGYLDCDNGQAGGACAGNDNVNEAGGTINYYWWKHQMKAQLGYFFTNEDTVGPSNSSNHDLNTNKWVFQLSSYF